MVVLHGISWKLNLAKSLYAKEEGQQPWTFMGNTLLGEILVEVGDRIDTLVELIEAVALVG